MSRSVPSTLARAVLVGAACLLLACETRPAPTPAPPENPITVEIANVGLGSLFLGGNEAPVSIADDSGRSWKTAPGTLDVLCDGCERSCGLAVDPVPVYIEIPAGKSYTQRWDGRLYDEISDGCPCSSGELSCMVIRPLPHGSYTLTVAYTDQPPPDTPIEPHTYDKTPQSDGTTRWVETIWLGLEQLDLEQSFPLSYSGQATIRLEIR